MNSTRVTIRKRQNWVQTLWHLWPWLWPLTLAFRIGDAMAVTLWKRCDKQKDRRTDWSVLELLGRSPNSHHKHVYIFGVYELRSDNGRIRLSVSTVNRTYELSGITHVTPFRKYGKHSTGPSTCGPWARTYSKLFSCKPVLTIWSYGAQSNEICTYGRVPRETIPRVRRYGLLYLRTVEYDHW